MRLSKNLRKSVPAFLTTLFVAASMLVGLVTPAQAEDKPQTAGGTVRSQPCTLGVSTIAECFPDPGLADIIYHAIYAESPDDILTQEIVVSITSLRINKKEDNVKSIAGIENLTALTQLSIYNADGLDLSPLKQEPLLNNLTNIGIISSKISNVEPLVSDLLIHFPNLKDVDLSHNSISDAQPLSRLHCQRYDLTYQNLTLQPLNASDNPNQSVTFQLPIGKNGNRVTPISIKPDTEGNPQVTQTSVIWNNSRGGSHSFYWNLDEESDDGESWFWYNGTVSQEIEIHTVFLALLYPSEPGVNSKPYVYRVAQGHKLTRPQDPPSQSGLRFLGWYTHAQGGTKFDFDTAFRDNITLYGHWSVDPGGTKPPLPTINCRIGLSSFKDCFPDSALANAVASVVNKQSTDPVTAEDIAHVSYITIDNKYGQDGHVENLNGIQILTNLEVLSIYDKRVEVQQGNLYTPTPALDLRPLSALTKLQNLDIDGGFLPENTDSNLQFTGGYWFDDLSPLNSLTNLTTLKLTYANLVDLNMLACLQDLQSLSTLILDDNNINDVTPLKNINFRALTQIGLDGNAISDLSPLKDSRLISSTTVSADYQMIVYKKGTADPQVPVELPDVITQSGAHLTPVYFTPQLNGQHSNETYSVIWNPPVTSEQHCSYFRDGDMPMRSFVPNYFTYSGRVCDRRTTEENPDRAVHRVHFDVNYDTPNPPKIDDQLVYDGDYARKPDGPIRRKYVLDHWSLDGAPFDFEHTPITRDLTLKAEWIPQYTVTFDTHGGNSIPEQTVPLNGLAVRPTDPVKAGVTFAGWFTEPDGAGEEADFSKPVTSDMTLHAKWTTKSVTPLSKLPLTGNLPWLIILPSAAAALILIGCLLYEIAKRLD